MASGSRSSFAAATKAHADAAAARRRAFIEAFLGNPQWTIKQTLAELGFSLRSYEVWRAKHPEFRAEVDRAKQVRAEHDLSTVPWDGSFTDFRKRYLGYDTYFFHAEIVRVLDHCPEGEVSMILLPVGSGKTTCLEDWANYKLAIDPNIRILYLSESQPEARTRLRRIQQRMTDENIAREYMLRFGPFYEERQEKHGKPWTADFFTVCKRDSGERDYSMAALGMTSQIYGKRADIIILDDVQTLKTLNKTGDYLRKFQQEILTRRPPGGGAGKVVIIGTRVGPGDFYETVLDRGIVNQKNLVLLPVHNADGKTLCPEMFPQANLEQLRAQVGEQAWWSAFMQKPHLGPNATFTETMIDSARTKMRKVGQVDEDEHVVMGVDPALEGNTGIVVLAYNRSHIAVVDCLLMERPASQEAILDGIAEFAGRYRPLNVVIETMAYQQALYRDRRLALMARRYGFRTHPHQTYGNKLDATFGVTGIARSFHLYELLIPDADDFSRRRMEPLVSELTSWRPDIKTKLLKQDLVMAMWFAWLHAMQDRGRPAAETSTEAFRFRSLRETYAAAGVRT